MINITPYNESRVVVEASINVLMEISDSFQFRVKDYKFHPKFKMGIWDGFVKMLDLRNNTFPKGLIPDLLKWAHDRDYSITVSSDIVQPFKEKIEFDWKDLHLPFEPRDFQEDAVKRCIGKKRQIILSSTGSGKSLIIYATIRAILPTILEMEGKVLLIVPSVNLVEQMAADFANYAKDDVFDVEASVHKIYDGAVKHTDKPIVISTWQSLQREVKNETDYLEQFGAVLCDEVHQFDGKTVGSVVNACKYAFFRFGFTGTLKESLTHEMELKAMFGPIHRVSSTKDLMDQNILATLSIKNLILKYDNVVSNLMSKANYQKEMDILVSIPERNHFITKLVASRKNNTLVLFQYVEKHGKVLHRMIKENCTDKQVFLVYGGTDIEMREKVRQICETHNDVVIVASYGCFSTGISINNLHNIVFASPTKSKIRVLQSIGRGLRLHDEKDVCTLFDIGDDLRGTRKTPNITLHHFIDRNSLYTTEGFSVEYISRNIHVSDTDTIKKRTQT